MAGIKISALPAIAAPALGDVFPVVQAGTTYKETITQLASLVSSNITNNSVTNAKLAQMGAYTIKGNNTNATADPQDIAAGQYPATHTNDDATAGNVGEFISSVIDIASAVPVVTATSTDIAMVNLTPGNWILWGNVYNINTGNNLAGTFSWISSTSATAPDPSMNNGFSAAGVVFTTLGISAPQLRFSLNATTTIYLTTYQDFAAGTGSACGGIYARRAR